MEINRKEFLKICGGACLGLVGISLMQSCNQFVEVTHVNNQLRFEREWFFRTKKGTRTYRKYVLVQPENSNYPIVVYRHDENNYHALLLKCTHQGAELSVSGDLITCSAHGSEFGNKGEVVQGPADKNLKSFVVTSDEKFIYVDLS